jgi:hypothetical protein
MRWRRQHRVADSRYRSGGHRIDGTIDSQNTGADN